MVRPNVHQNPYGDNDADDPPPRLTDHDSATGLPLLPDNLSASTACASSQGVRKQRNSTASSDSSGSGSQSMPALKPNISTPGLVVSPSEAAIFAKCTTASLAQMLHA